MVEASPSSPLRSRVVAAWRTALDTSILMITGAGIALVWANLSPESYERVTHPVHFAVNDIAMVFFFGLATKEIVEATAPGGALHSLRRAAVPVIAAAGGMAGPALLYVGMALAAGAPELLRGWAIPAATDIAFSYLVARVIFGTTHPAVPFLLLLAIADDALGLLILAVFYPSGEIRPLLFAALLVVACGAAWVLRRKGTRSFWAVRPPARRRLLGRLLPRWPSPGAGAGPPSCRSCRTRRTTQGYPLTPTGPSTTRSPRSSTGGRSRWSSSCSSSR